VYQADRMEKTGSEMKSAACFEVPSHYEVTALGRKLVGSAQVRRMGVVLQHGSLPLTGDVSRLVDVLKLPEAERDRLRQVLHRRAIALDEAMGRQVSFDEAAEAVARGFSEALDLDLEPGALSDHEMAHVEGLRPRYLGDEWTFSK
jgi:lipoate-protein ligase A